MKYFIVVLLFAGLSLNASAQTVTQAEYFIDTDAGVGKNTLLNVSLSADSAFSYTVNLSGVVPGRHKLFVRTKDGAGKWSHTISRNIVVLQTNGKNNIVSGEYFFDEYPRFNAAAAITISPQDTAILQNFTAAVVGLSPGHHKLYMRLKDANGNWGITARRNVEVVNSLMPVISGAEYFFNTDPGVGNATKIKFANPYADSSFAFKIPISQIPPGAHTLYIRTRDSANNNWSITQWQPDSTGAIVTSVQSGKWSQPATWSNNKVPDSNTIVLLYHNVAVDIVDAVCRSLTPYGSNVKCNVEAGKALKITGYQ